MEVAKTNGLLDRLLASPLSVLFIILSLVCVSYSNSLKSPLVLDDGAVFIEVERLNIEGFSLESLQQLSTNKFGKSRLLPMFSFAFDLRFGQGSIVQFHLTNIIIHLLATSALYILLQGIVRTSVGRQSLFFMSPHHFCLFVTAIWALHPVQTNAVTYLAQRMTSMAAMFYLASLAFYVHARIRGAGICRYILYAGCLCSATCAFLSKENSATLPLAVLLVEFIFITPDLCRRIIVFTKWYYWIFLAIVILLLFPVGIGSWDDIMSFYDMRSFTMSERLLTEFRVVAFYISLMALPLPGRMNLEHDFSISSSLISPPTTILSFMLITGLLIWGWRVRKTQPLISFGVFWFLLNLVIESTIIPLELIFEHRLYLPSVGFFIVFIVFIDQARLSVRRYDRQMFQRIVFLGVAICAIALSLLTTMRNHTWRDFVSLTSDCVRKSPNKPRALNNYGLALAQDGRHQEAIDMFEKAIAKGQLHNEDFVKSATNILSIFLATDKYNESVRRGEEYLSRITVDIKRVGLQYFLYNLGRSYGLVGRYSEALSVFMSGVKLKTLDKGYLIQGMEDTISHVVNVDEKGRKELELGSDPIDVPIRMAYYMIRLREYERALGYINKAMSINPENKTLFKIQNNFEQDIEKNRMAEQLSDIRNDPAYKSIGLFRFYVTLADLIMEHYPPLLNQVGWLLSAAEGIEPSSLFVAADKARWLMKTGRYEDAVQILEETIRQNQNFPPSLELAGACYLKLGQADKAAIVFDHLLDRYPGHQNWQTYEDIILRVNRQETVGNNRPFRKNGYCLVKSEPLHIKNCIL